MTCERRANRYAFQWDGDVMKRFEQGKQGLDMNYLLKPGMVPTRNRNGFQRGYVTML